MPQDICGDLYVNTARPGLPDPLAPLPQSDSIFSISLRMLALAEENILLNSGRLTVGRFDDFYHIPAQRPVIESGTPSLIGPPSLVAQARDAGLTVTAHASVSRYDETRDRNNLHSIIDGIMDNSFLGTKPYWTYIPADQPRPDEVWFEVRFSEPVLLTGLTFYEGDRLWSHINTYYRDDETIAGPIDDLRITLLTDHGYTCPDSLAFSDSGDPWTMYETISATFAPTLGNAIRLSGTPAGRYATILELQPEGQLSTPHAHETRSSASRRDR